MEARELLRSRDISSRIFANSNYDKKLIKKVAIF
jgi:hypothetical protein